MIFVKFYPGPADQALETTTAIRIRKLIAEILADLESNYAVQKEERMIGPMRGGQYYELDGISRDALIERLSAYESVYSVQKKSIEFNGKMYQDALLIRLG